MLLVIASSIILFDIIAKLVDFQSDHINPLDICTTLGKRVNPLLYLQIAICIVSLLQVRYGWIVCFIHIIIILSMIRRLRRNRRYFEPMIIVRDSAKYKLEHVLYMTGCVITCIIILALIFVDVLKAFSIVHQ